MEARPVWQSYRQEQERKEQAGNEKSWIAPCKCHQIPVVSNSDSDSDSDSDRSSYETSDFSQGGVGCRRT